MMKFRGILFTFLAGLLVCCSSPNEPAKKGFTAREAEQLASTRALEIWGNPVLVKIETPENGGGVNRQGRLARGENGKWAFGYMTAGAAQGLLIEVVATRAYDYSVPLNQLESLQEILPNYIDSSTALTVAEKNGGKDLGDVEYILCKLFGEPIWPTPHPTKVAWQVEYRRKGQGGMIYFIEAYSGVYLGKEITK